MQGILKKPNELLYHVSCILLCILFFGLDLIFPLGYAAGTLYVVVIIIIGRLDNHKALWSYAALSTLLTLIGFIYSFTLFSYD